MEEQKFWAVLSIPIINTILCYGGVSSLVCVFIMAVSYTHLNFRPGTMKKYGLDYESVKKIKPDIVYASLTTFGQTGKYVSKPGYDIIAQARCV